MHQEIEELNVDLIHELELGKWKYVTAPMVRMVGGLLSFLIFLPITASIDVPFVRLLLLIIVSRVVAYLLGEHISDRFSFLQDHRVVGSLQFKASSIKIVQATESIEMDLEKTSVLLKYRWIRGKYQNDAINGISEIFLNEKGFKFIVHNETQHRLLAQLLEHWYEQAFQVLECTNDKNQYRLLKLERDFDWKEWEQVKANNEKRAGTSTQSFQ